MGALLAILLSAVLPVAPARPTPVDADARAGLVVWSSYDAHSKMYRLMARRDGLAFRVRVAPAATPFDADAGTDARGRPAIAFVRDGDVHVFTFDGAGGVMWRVRCGEVHPRCTLKTRPVP